MSDTPQLPGTPGTNSPAPYLPKGLIRYPKDLAANALFRAEILKQTENDPLFAKEIYRICAQTTNENGGGILFWINTFCWTKDTREQLCPSMPFVTYQFQDKYILDLQAAVLGGYDILTEKSRDMGASWCVMYVMQWFFQFKNGADFIVGSRKEEYVDQLGDMKTLLEKVRFNLERQPDWLLPPQFRQYFEDFTGYMRLLNAHQQNSVIGESMNKHFGSGARAIGVVMDEFAKVENGVDDAVWTSTADVTPCRIVLSTPVGAANKFARLALGQDSKIKTCTLHWTLHPEKNKDCYYINAVGENAGQKIPIDCSVEYDAAFKVWLAMGRVSGSVRSSWWEDEATRRTAAEMAQEVDIDYAQSGSPYFNMAAIYKQVPWTYHRRNHPGEEIPHQRHIRVNLLEIGGKVEIREQEDGWLRLYEFPRESYQYALAGDSAEGLAKGDEAFGVCRDKATNHIVADFNGHYPPDEFALKLRLLGWYFFEADNAPENNNHGYSTCKELLGMDHVRMYYTRDDKGQVTQKAGFTTTAKTRPLMLDLMAKQVDKAYFEIRSEIILAQCRTFIKNPKRSGHPEAGGAFHDDGIIACAIAGAVIDECPYKPEEHKKKYIQHEAVQKRLGQRNAGFSFR